MNQVELQHLLSRAGFGLSTEYLKKFQGLTRAEVIDQLFEDSKSTTPLNIDLSDFLNEANQLSVRNKKDLVALVKNSKKKFLELNNQWLNRIMSSNEELRERMTLFWTNHFVCKDSNVYHMQLYLNSVKENALGNFGDFVKTISKQPSMLKYLNGKQNRKTSPNENFARELMELFTLGEGNYTEKDIRESARAFTGYSHNFMGDFIFRKFQHDTGKKTFLEQSGYFDGDDIINIILKDKQCSRFVCTKLYTYFVNPTPNQTHIDELTEVFYRDYEISKVMKFLFNQDWFYVKENIAVKIKSPIDLLASMYRVWPYTFEDEKSWIKIEKLLGQNLLDPPNVAGWAGGKSWIDTNTLMIRLNLPSLVYGINLKDGAKINSFRGRRKNPFAAQVDVNAMNLNYKDFSNEQIQTLVLIKNSIPEVNRVLFYSESKAITTVRLMSLPEFQLC